MIKNVMFIISFVTSSVCFIDLIRNKKQYRSLAYLILIVLIFTFIRPILVLFYNYNYYIRVAAIVFQIIIALSCCCVDYNIIYENGHRLYVEKWYKILIYALLTIVANVVGVACCYNPFKDADLIINCESFEYINARFVNALSTMTTDRSLYGFLKQNLLIVLKKDQKIRKDAFNQKLDQTLFIEYIFELFIFSIVNPQQNYQGIIELVERYLY